MAYLKKIIEQIEKDFKVHVHGTIPLEQQIDSIQFLLPRKDDNYDLLPSILYLASYQDFYNQTLEGTVLYLNCHNVHFNETGLYIYQQLNPMELSNCIQKELLRSHQAKKKREEMFNILHAGYGIKSIINTART